MITADDALAYCLLARTRTYAAGHGQTDPLLPGAHQFEHTDGAWAYRDVYYQGNGVFPGLETVFHEGRPVWSMSYFGDYSRMSEVQADTMLRPALLALWETTRTGVAVEHDFPGYRYTCAGHGTAAGLGGREEILVDGECVYWLVYAGGFIG